MGVGAYIGCFKNTQFLLFMAVGKQRRPEAVPSEEGRVGVLDDAALAVAFHEAQRLHRHLAVLDVEQLEVEAVGRHDLQPLARDALAGLEAEPLEVEAVQGQALQARVRDQRALADVQGLELGAVLGEVLHAVVRDALAAPRVEVAQLAAVLGHVADAHVGDPAAVRDAEVPQARLQLGDLPQAEVADEAAVADAQLLDGRAVDHQVAQALVGEADAAAQVQVGQLRAVRRDGVQALVLQHEAVRHVQVADGNLFAMQGGQFNGGLPGQADAGHFGAPYTERQNTCSEQPWGIRWGGCWGEEKRACPGWGRHRFLPSPARSPSLLGPYREGKQGWILPVH